MSESSQLHSAAQAERRAEQLKAGLAETLDQLTDNLMPRRLAAEAVDAAAARTPDWLKRYWHAAGHPVALGLVGATAASIALGIVLRRRG